MKRVESGGKGRDHASSKNASAYLFLEAGDAGPGESGEQRTEVPAEDQGHAGLDGQPGRLQLGGQAEADLLKVVGRAERGVWGLVEGLRLEVG